MTPVVIWTPADVAEAAELAKQLPSERVLATVTDLAAWKESHR